MLFLSIIRIFTEIDYFLGYKINFKRVFQKDTIRIKLATNNKSCGNPHRVGNNTHLKKQESRRNHKRNFEAILNKLFQKKTICKYS